MHVEKLPSGSYRYREYINGKKVSLTVKKKISDREALLLMSEKVKTLPSEPQRALTTFSDAYAKYIEVKSKVLSPSTLYGYRNVYKNIPQSFKDKRIYEITKIDVQKLVNDYSADHSPKSVSNYYGLITTVLRMYEINITATLPQKEKKTPYIPSPEEVRRFFEKAKGSQYEASFLLAAMGLRRSELRAATLDDLDENNVLTINKALVLGNDGYVVKGTKTTDSTRTLVLPPYLADLIRRQGFIFKGSQTGLDNELKRIQRECGIPHFSIHKFRHFFASYLHDLGYSDKAVQEAGGWKSDSVLKTVYQHALDTDKKKAEMANKMGDLFS